MIYLQHKKEQKFFAVWEINILAHLFDSLKYLQTSKQKNWL